VSITEYERHLINQWLEEVMGPERAAIMMQLLPPLGWGDIATKADLHALRSELRAEMTELRADVREQQASTLRTMVVTMVASQATLVGLVLAAVNLG
jgi:hypothetical protein